MDYFGFQGTYTTDENILRGNPAVTDPETGKIYYGDYPFSQNYDHLYLVADHEMRHSANISNAINEGRFNTKRYLEYTEPDYYMKLDEFNTHRYNYYRQGLYPTHGTDILNHINGYGMQIGASQFNSQWWHFIYKMPRRW